MITDSYSIKLFWLILEIALPRLGSMLLLVVSDNNNRSLIQYYSSRHLLITVTFLGTLCKSELHKHFKRAYIKSWLSLVVLLRQY